MSILLEDLGDRFRSTTNGFSFSLQHWRKKEETQWNSRGSLKRSSKHRFLYICSSVCNSITNPSQVPHGPGPLPCTQLACQWPMVHVCSCRILRCAVETHQSLQAQKSTVGQYSCIRCIVLSSKLNVQTRWLKNILNHRPKKHSQKNHENIHCRLGCSSCHWFWTPTWRWRLLSFPRDLGQRQL